MSTPRPHFTEPTTNYWQSILPPAPLPPPLPSSSTTPPQPYKYAYPATLPDSRILMLPIRPLRSDPSLAVASLLVNHASLSVVAELGGLLAERVGERWWWRTRRRMGGERSSRKAVGADLEMGVGVEADADVDAEVLIGVPTLGLCVVGAVAERLGCDRYVPLGYSRKFWYDDELSAEVSSITSPGVGLKRVYLDPNLLPLVKGKRVVIVDDAVSSGKTLKAVWDLLEGVGCVVEGAGVVMVQGSEWKSLLGEERVGRVVSVLESPFLRAVDEGWVAR